jgi:hypothetical protein
MLQSLDLNTASERSAVQGFTLQTVARLSPNDAVLPQVLNICDMVQRGIGVVSADCAKISAVLNGGFCSLSSCYFVILLFCYV